MTRKTLDECEREMLREALDRHQGDKKSVALELGVCLKTVYNKLKRHELLDGLHGRFERNRDACIESRQG